MIDATEKRCLSETENCGFTANSVNVNGVKYCKCKEAFPYLNTNGNCDTNCSELDTVNGNKRCFDENTT